jgi:hypothetical protein
MAKAEIRQSHRSVGDSARNLTLRPIFAGWAKILIKKGRAFAGERTSESTERVDKQNQNIQAKDLWPSQYLIKLFFGATIAYRKSCFILHQRYCALRA